MSYGREQRARSDYLRYQEASLAYSPAAYLRRLVLALLYFTLVLVYKGRIFYLHVSVNT